MANRAYTRKQFIVAVSLPALLGWAVVTAPYIFRVATSPDVSAEVGLPLWLLLLAPLAGIPIALIVCWLVGGPVLWQVMRRPVGWRRAIFWGVAIPLLIVMLGVIVNRLWGLYEHLNPHYHFQNGGGQYITEVDGILTPYGWWVAAQDSLTFVLIGLAIALIVRAIVGPGRPVTIDAAIGA